MSNKTFEEFMRFWHRSSAESSEREVAKKIWDKCHKPKEQQEPEEIPKRKENDCRRILIIEDRPSKIEEAKVAFKIESSPEVEEKICQGEAILNKDGVEIIFAKDYDDAHEKVKHNWFDSVIDDKADTLPHFAHMKKMMDIKLNSIQKGVDYMIIKEEEA